MVGRLPSAISTSDTLHLLSLSLLFHAKFGKSGRRKVSLFNSPLEREREREREISPTRSGTGSKSARLGDRVMLETKGLARYLHRMDVERDARKRRVDRANLLPLSPARERERERIERTSRIEARGGSKVNAG